MSAPVNRDTEARAGPRVVHVTTVHPRDDIRIFHKECRSLARAGYEVLQVVGDGLGDALVGGVRIRDIGSPPRGRLQRMRRQPLRALQAVRALRADLVHLHDPELLPMGAALAREGVKTVYDAHEDLPRQILTKQWVAPALRRPLGWAVERYENWRVRRLSGVVAATPHIASRFAALQLRVATVCNYPLLEELGPPDAADDAQRENAVCYVGLITRLRGAREMLQALASVPGLRLLLCGRFEDAALERELRASPGWDRVEYLGQVGREQVQAVLARAFAGLVTLQAMPSYLDALPIKMFEYMHAGLPVIASDFPLWRGIVEEAGCGLCVDPADPLAIAQAMRTLQGAPRRARAMGEAGHRAVLERYNWPCAEAELLAFYRALLA